MLVPCGDGKITVSDGVRERRERKERERKREGERRKREERKKEGSGERQNLKKLRYQELHSLSIYL